MCKKALRSEDGADFTDRNCFIVDVIGGNRNIFRGNAPRYLKALHAF